MGARSRVRRVAICMGLTISIALAGLWFLSARDSIIFRFAGGATFAVESGVVYQTWLVGPQAGIQKCLSDIHWTAGWSRSSEMMVYPFWHRLAWGLRFPRFYNLGAYLPPGVFQRGFDVPIWLLILVSSSATAYLWFCRGHGAGFGHCLQCGYDLTKNESGRCPECGTLREKVKGSAEREAKELERSAAPPGRNES